MRVLTYVSNVTASALSLWAISVAMVACLAGLYAGTHFIFEMVYEWQRNSIEQADIWYALLTETGFYQAFSLVFANELGDKTFFVAALLAMRATSWTNTIASLGAAFAVSLLSVVVGRVFIYIPAAFMDYDGYILPIGDVFAAMAFLIFGVKSLTDALHAIEKAADSSANGRRSHGMECVAKKARRSSGWKQGLHLLIKSWGPMVINFTLVVGAEFGERSFLSIVALSSAQKRESVVAGAACAHVATTCIAVMGGSMMAKYVSDTFIGVAGGALFIVFAVTTFFGVF